MQHDKCNELLEVSFDIAHIMHATTKGNEDKSNERGQEQWGHKHGFCSVHARNGSINEGTLAFMYDAHIETCTSLYRYMAD